MIIIIMNKKNLNLDLKKAPEAAMFGSCLSASYDSTDGTP